MRSYEVVEMVNGVALYARTTVKIHWASNHEYDLVSAFLFDQESTS